MIPVTPLLTAVTVTKTFRRNIHVILFHCKKVGRDVFVYHMTTIPLKHLLIKNLKKEASGVEALFSTYVDLIESNASESTHRKFEKSIMEPYLNTCYGSSSDHRSYDASTVTFKDALKNHESTSSTPTYPDLNTMPTNDISRVQQNYKAMRTWRKVGRGRNLPTSEKNCVIRLFSYNILAQYLLEMHSYLYKHHNQRTLEWETRKKLLIQEILEAQATVICLQEMQEDHLNEFLKPFKEHKYNHLYKKRTNDKKDGLLLMYRSDVFDLVEYENVEFFQSDVEILNRDNVAIIVKLSLKDSPETQIVIATTHLLYNPKRDDIRLCQTQILIAELERIAFIKNTSRGPTYHPIILAGDFNLQPKSGVYKFITEGSFLYMGKSRTLGPADHRSLSNSLIPPHLYVTDSCQHFCILLKRLRNRGEGKVMLENSEKGLSKTSWNSCDKNQFRKDEVNVRNKNFQKIQILDGHHVNFGSGSLTHPFKFRSVYSHIDRNGQNEATTHQDGWVTVDYIFFSEVELIERYTLPTQKQCKAVSSIPNREIGSDHFSTGATFILRKKLRQ